MPDQQPLSPLIPRRTLETTIPNVIPNPQHHHSFTLNIQDNTPSPSHMDNRLPPLMMPYGSSPRLPTLEPFTTTTTTTTTNSRPPFPSPSFSSPSSSSPSLHSPPASLPDLLSDIVESIPNQDTLTEDQTFMLWNQLLRRLYPQNGEFDHYTRTMEIDGSRVLLCQVGPETKPSSTQTESVYTPAAIIVCKGADEYHRRDTWERTSHQLGVLFRSPGRPWCAVAFGCRLVCAYKHTQKFEGIEMNSIKSSMFDLGTRNGRVMVKRLLDKVRAGAFHSLNEGMWPDVH
ncbi:hypothetical protein ASPBRDRAFT_58706 [Aspergillus brasiliensis CBS 101740]|uniref:Uncharacterized protein n=1 Tax=Aspergillus brasiliensis (strain CBS 101740 / IMI 381727 / IBT 21946) TaxID=767769 RepID=A0A1L9U7K1_ASPBC|nr:hypothetical protein ASPBRDRAFT_58706 [Aspergillus brasiliensis CBS 101740]